MFLKQNNKPQTNKMNKQRKSHKPGETPNEQAFLFI